jgi:hypothetical protein
VYDDTPIYDALFEMEVNLSERFPAMTPLTLRKERAHEVFLLINRYNRYSKKEAKQKNGKRIIRRPAGDDWF